MPGSLIQAASWRSPAYKTPGDAEQATTQSELAKLGAAIDRYLAPQPAVRQRTHRWPKLRDVLASAGAQSHGVHPTLG